MAVPTQGSLNCWNQREKRARAGQPGRKPDFVNENNALCATVKPTKFNEYNHLVLSRENLRAILNPTYDCAAGVAHTSASGKSIFD